jgi:RHS repeat-associated protein
VKRWIYADALRPVAQFDASGELEATFVYATRSNVPDFMVRKEGTTFKTYRFITDHLGSVRLVVDAACTHTSGANIMSTCVLQRTDYDEFGNITSETLKSNDASLRDLHPFGFAGGMHDRDTGLVRFGARDYDPWAGRWLRRDPILFRGGQANLHSYVGNDPINLLDSSGELAFLATAAIGGVVGGIAGGIAALASGHDVWGAS